MNWKTGPDSFAIEALFPNWHNEEWVSYTLKSILEAMASEQVRVGATVMAKAAHVRNRYVHPLMHRYVYRFVGSRIVQPMQMLYRSANRRLAAGDVAYFWLGNPPDLCRRLQDRGVMVAREMINCTLALRRGELQKAYRAIDLPDGSGITDEAIDEERGDILAADVVFCPNAHVKASVTAYGFPAERCIEASYGWSESRMAGATTAVARDGTFTAAFVGTVDVRKGAPTLLEAWVRSKTRGRLLLAGNISPEIRQKYGDILARKDVICLGHVTDVGSVYRAADVFCFPTWEEGGPQVTLEAMSAGNVPIVTSMGTAGAFTEADDIGIIVEPGSVDAISDALHLMSRDIDRRRHLAQQSKLRAGQFTWALVGQRRRAALVQQRRAWLERR